MMDGSEGISERHYSLCVDLGRVESARRIISNITPLCGHECIKTDERNEIGRALSEWESRLHKAIEAESSYVMADHTMIPPPPKIRYLYYSAEIPSWAIKTAFYMCFGCVLGVVVGILL